MTKNTDNIITVKFPAPHTRPRASTNMMVGWGYYTWAKEMIEAKYGLKLTQSKRRLDEFTGELPSKFDLTAFSKKLGKLYNISVFVHG